MHTAAGGASASASGSVGSAVPIDINAHCGLMLTLQRSLNQEAAMFSENASIAQWRSSLAICLC